MSFSDFIRQQQPDLVRAIRRITRRFGVDVIRFRENTLHNQLGDSMSALLALRALAESGAATEDLEFIDWCAAHFKQSKAQIFQDLFVLRELRQKRGGFFVEFGATNGILLSNTYLLEKEYAWSGILAEPARGWHPDLKRNRDCAIDLRCVFDRSGEQVVFNEAEGAEASTIEEFSSKDMHAHARRHGTKYPVVTVSLNDLLKDHGAPVEIDYLSIDTEGSELRILSAFDFSKYLVRTLTVEHNYTADRDRIHELLTSKGLVRKFESFSQWDSWYVTR